MARADVGYTVRQAAVHVWKTIVTNTPRTTGEILKMLMDQIILSLAHTSKPNLLFFLLVLSAEVQIPITDPTCSVL